MRFADYMRTILIPMFAGFQPLDVTGPYEVFIAANDALDELGVSAEKYSVSLIGSSLEPVQSESGLSISPHTSFPSTKRTTIDTVLVPGGRTTRDGDNGDLIEWLQQHGHHTRRIASVCTGTFLLARAGLITEQRVTTHWAYSGLLATRFPKLTVDPDPIFIVDGNVWTSAGVTAGIDLALAMVEADCGATVAQLVAIRGSNSSGRSPLNSRKRKHRACRDRRAHRLLERRDTPSGVSSSTRCLARAVPAQQHQPDQNQH